MDDGSRMLLISLVFLLFAAMYFAAMETAFASVSKIRIKTRSEHGDKKAVKALYILDNFDLTISTLLIGTNIVHISTASIVTLYVTKNWGVSYVSISTILTTIVVFFAGEMLPKIIGKRYSETFAISGASSLCFFMAIFSPFAHVLSFIGNKAANLSGDEAVTVTEEELYDIIEDMTGEGSLDTERGELISSALSFSELTAETVLTARVDLAAIDVDWNMEKIIDFIKSERHSRMPVYENTVDNIIGVLQIRKLLKSYIKNGKQADIREHLDEAFFVHGGINIDELLELMSEKKLNLVIVSDNYGGTLGIVTVEDILEELVGDIWDEDDVVEETFVELADGEYEVDAELTVGEVFDKLHLSISRDELERLEHMLMGAWVYEELEKIPEENESFISEGLEVLVSVMKNNRVMKLKVREARPSKVDGGVPC